MRNDPWIKKSDNHYNSYMNQNKNSPPPVKKQKKVHFGVNFPDFDDISVLQPPNPGEISSNINKIDDDAYRLAIRQLALEIDGIQE